MRDNPYSAAQLGATQDYVGLAGPVFVAPDLDTLEDLKSNRDLRNYSNAFIAAIGRVGSTESRVELLNAIQAAISSAALSRRIGGVFEGTATALNVVGLVPVLGSAASIAGLGAEGASRLAASRERSNRWFELAAQVRRYSSLSQLERRIAKQLESGPPTGS